MAHPPTKSAGPVLRAGLTERFVTNPDQVDEGQTEADRYRGHASRCALVGTAHDDEQEEGREYHLSQQRGGHAVPTGTVRSVPVGREVS